MLVSWLFSTTINPCSSTCFSRCRGAVKAALGKLAAHPMPRSRRALAVAIQTKTVSLDISMIHDQEVQYPSPTWLENHWLIPNLNGSIHPKNWQTNCFDLCIGTTPDSEPLLTGLDGFCIRYEAMKSIQPQDVVQSKKIVHEYDRYLIDYVRRY